jgi:hypothetical protein
MIADGAGAPSEDPLATKLTKTHEGNLLPGLYPLAGGTTAQQSSKTVPRASVE